MGNPLSIMRRWFSSKLREEDGTATIPFVIFVPFFMAVVVASLEMGILMTRWVMLERALDITVRDLRLGHLPGISHSDFRDMVCDRSALIPDCKNVLLIELRPVSTVTWAPLNTGAVCVDRGNPLDPLDFEFTQGAGDQLMLVRACAKFDPIFDTSAVGLDLPKDDTGAYSLVTQTAYVNEPES
ncbi:MAG: pilus assembly protein [Paracoccaceae bacterium]